MYTIVNKKSNAFFTKQSYTNNGNDLLKWPHHLANELKSNKRKLVNEPPTYAEAEYHALGGHQWSSKIVVNESKPIFETEGIQIL
jgi:hypothetical protein